LADASHEVSLVPFSVFRPRRTAPSDHAPGHPASAFVATVGTQCHDRLLRPCGFYRLAFPMRSLCSVGNAVRWVIRDRLTIGARTGPGLGLFSRPGRFLFGFRQRSWDLIMLFAVLLWFAGGGVFQRLEPTCRLASCPPRVSSSRSLSTRGQLAAASGVWPREPAVPCDLSVPQKLLCTGPNQIHQP